MTYPRRLTQSQSRRRIAALRGRGYGVRVVRMRGADVVLRTSKPSLGSMQYFNTPGGMGHAKACLPKIAQFASEASQTFEIRDLAVRIVANVPGKDELGELKAIYVWVRDNIRYRKDPKKLELLQRPSRTLKWRAGDCGAITTLIAALAESLGYDVQYRTVGESPNAPSHVQAQVRVGACVVDMDPVMESRAALQRPRPNDLGKFGQQAPGAQQLWNKEGFMIGFAPTAQEKMLWTHPLGFVPSEQDRELWVFTPWENQKLLGGVRPGQRVIVVARPGQISGADAYGRVRYYHPTLGAWGFLKKIGKAVAGVAGGAIKIVKKVVNSPITKVLFPVAAVANIKSPIQQAVLKAIPGGTQLQQAANKVISVANSVEKYGAKPVSKAAAQASGLKKITTTGALQNLTTSGALQKLTASVRTAVASVAKRVSTTSLASRLRSLTSGSWLYTRPSSSGLSGLRPSFSVSLGADPATIKQLAQRAIDTVAAYTKAHGAPPAIRLPDVRAFQEADGTLSKDSEYGPNTRVAAAYYLNVPAASLPKVAAKWANYPITWKAPIKATPAKTTVKKAPAKAATPTKAATPAKTVVAVAPAKAPPAPAAAPAAKPWNQSPALVTLAKAAVAQVRAFIAANKQPPQVKLAKVKAYQDAFKSAAIANAPAANKSAVSAALARFNDQLWGPDTQEMAANTLNVPIASLPPYASVYAKKTSSTTTTPAKVPAKTGTRTDGTQITSPTAAKAAAAKAAAASAAAAKAKTAAAKAAAAKAAAAAAKAAAAAAKAAGGGDAAAKAAAQNALDDAARAAAAQQSDQGLNDPWADEQRAERDKSNKKWLYAAGAYYLYTRRRRAA